jgi:RNA polymerase sigma factor (sigma-70 family)
VWTTSDETVLTAVAAGDTGAAKELIKRYQRRVYGVAAAIVGAGPEAEDVAQETFLRVWRHARAFDARRASVATWVLAIARHAAIDTVRLRRSEVIAPETIAKLGLTEARRGPEEVAVTATELARVCEALGHLPETQCEALVAASLLGLTAAEIARAKGVPLGTVKSRIRAGLRQTRDRLQVEEVA